MKLWRNFRHEAGDDNYQQKRRVLRYVVLFFYENSRMISLTIFGKYIPQNIGHLMEPSHRNRLIISNSSYGMHYVITFSRNIRATSIIKLN